jgi:hypothetical protein
LAANLACGKKKKMMNVEPDPSPEDMNVKLQDLIVFEERLTETMTRLNKSTRIWQGNLNCTSFSIKLSFFDFIYL